MKTRIEQALKRIQEVSIKAKALYGVDLSDLNVRFDLRGKAAGQAGQRGEMRFIRLNTDMIENDSFNHLIEQTIPHEIAHIVCIMRPMLGYGHNAGWKRVCKTLGGNGETYHTQPVKPARRTRKFVYITSSGRPVQVSLQRHKAIQNGTRYLFKEDNSKLNSDCKFTELTIA